MSENRGHLSLVPPLGAEFDAVEVKTVELPASVDAELELLSPQEREVMRLRLGLDIGRPRNHGEVASMLGMLEPSVALSEIRALGKLRNAGNPKAESQPDAD